MPTSPRSGPAVNRSSTATCHLHTAATPATFVSRIQNCQGGRLRLVAARAVYLRHARPHRPEVRRDLPAMMDDVEEEAPGHGGRRPLRAEEIEITGPPGGRQVLPARGHAGALLIV